MHALNRMLGGALIITGTCVGAGMLALPIVTAAGGFYNAALFFFLGWLMMTVAGFLILEVNLWTKRNVHIISMAKITLGKPGKIVAWISFSALLYSANWAFISGGATIFNELIVTYTDFATPHWLDAFIFAVILAVVVYFGTAPVDYFNRLLMMGLVISFVVLVIFLLPKVDTVQYSIGEIKYLPATLPIIITAFTFQFIIPSLRSYLPDNTKQIALTVLIGSLIPLALYILWTSVIMGVVPMTGEQSLLALQLDNAGAQALAVSLEQQFSARWVLNTVLFFSLFAIVTSCLGVTLGLVDFLSDGLKYTIKRTPIGRIFIIILALTPSLILAMSDPDGFEKALSYAGTAIAVLLGILPALMVWSGRYYSNVRSNFKVPGGRVTLVLMIVASCIVIMMQFAERLLGWLPTPTL